MQRGGNFCFIFFPLSKRGTILWRASTLKIISPDNENVLKDEPRRNCVYLIASVCMTDAHRGFFQV